MDEEKFEKLKKLVNFEIYEGQYKVYVRGYIDKNFTIGEFEGTFVMKANHANRAEDFSMLNMG